ncbi:rhamnulokinase [Aquibacillus sp. 3ASR75-11]|uniref:Rhamnulokinase n=1 Tax=Terrihalobacillus insolitus TaxID=2950438 RepID=A0A9X4ALH7_9BACI|nr:rhamnulokinase family protein [Terrihalobacillus insolitus]MDC3424402.1 rhamnulokinase [Terrihalobacillus insolitus]
MTVLAFDLGASGGRGIIGQLENNTLKIREIHRFSNDPVQIGDHLHWDILRLFYEIKQGILKARRLGYTDIESLAIDSWAVDFGLIDKNGELLANPYHYRDLHTSGMIEEIHNKITKEEIFFKTGIQFMQINTIYHLYAMKKAKSIALKEADTLLMIPDLLRYFLTGEKHSEYTNSTTTQLYNPTQGNWDEDILKTLDLPTEIFLRPVKPGTKVGELTPSICNELGLSTTIPVLTVGEHDTASAIAAVPASNEEYAYLSCGTWSLLGTEVKEPIINQLAFEWNVTNEGGVNDTFRLLKNIMGLWIIQECHRTWEKEGDPISFDEQNELATTAKPFRSLIDPDDAMFINPLHMPKQIQNFCLQTNQAVPHTKAEIIRCILDSLAMKYRFVLEKLESLTEVKYNGLHMVGGGIQNTLLCQFTSNAINRPVLAGPIEASSIGNILVQFEGLGRIKSLKEARELVRGSFPIKSYQPKDKDVWDEGYQTFCKILGC